MSFKCQIKDYQIIKKASLDFIPGLNVIIGPSNNGKTSILKAIKASVFTIPGATPIRAGQSSYIVGISYNNHTVILQKGNKESVYLVDGEKYTKFGVNTPEAVSEALNIKELVLNGNKEQLNFWDQMNYPFLLDKSSVELFRFIIDSGDNDKVSNVLKSMVTDRQQLSKEIDILQGSINTIDLQIEELKTTLDKSKPIVEACNEILELQSKVARLNLLKQIKEEHSNIKLQKSNLDSNYNKTFSKLKIYREFLDSYKAKLSKLNTLKDLFSNLHITVGDISNLVEQINKLKPIKELKTLDTSKLSSLKEIKKMLNNIISKKKEIESHSHVTWNYSDNDLNKLKELRRIRLEKLSIESNKEEFSNQLKECKKSIKLYKELKNKFDVCPLCGNKLH